MVDYLLVGQGVAGTLLGHYLQKKGQTIAFVDDGNAQSASRIAAGLVNPITGRRYVKSWNIDLYMPFAKTLYQTLEQEFQTTFWLDKRVSWVLDSPKMCNDWELLTANPDWESYVTADLCYPLQSYKDTLHSVVGIAEIQQAARVNLWNLLKTYRAHWQAQSIPYLQEPLDDKELKIEPKQVVYKDILAKNIVFCDGHKGAENPYWSFLPFNPAKGEILIVQIPNYPLNDILLKHESLFIIHLQEDKYWVGSSYLREYTNELPTETEKQTLENQLHSALKIPFTVLEHWAGVRPTTRDRRPFLGKHLDYTNVFVFNGLGAKGSYLAPYLADMFSNYLVHQTPLDKEVDIARLKELKNWKSK